MATGRLMVWAAIGAAMWVLVATGACPRRTGAWPTTAGAVRIGAGAKRGGCGSANGAGANAGAANNGPAGARRPAWALAMAAKMVKATKYDCIVCVCLWVCFQSIIKVSG